MTLRSFIPLFLTLLLIPLAAQEKEETTEPSPPLSAIERKRETLSRILVRRDAITEQIEKLRKTARARGLTEFETNEAAKKIADLQIESESLDDEFAEVSIGVDLNSLGEHETGTFSLNDEIKEVFQPIVQEFRDITAAPREAEELRTQIDDIERQIVILDNAEKNLAETVSKTNSNKLAKALDDKAKEISVARQGLETELGIAQTKLEDRQKDSPTFFQSLSTLVQNFFRSRGCHLLIAMAAAVFVVLLVRLAYRMVMKFSPKKVHRGENFTGRIIYLGYLVISILGGVLAFIISLYLANDWLLLAVSLLFLVGIAWTGKQALPKYFEQAKMMLNLGTVRHGERLIYQGIPWEVQKINFYTDLKNPALEGGLIRLPIIDLMPLHSRPTGPRELWFPCRDNDWVILSDGTFGKVIAQTPDYVHLVKLGGSRKVIPTADFLALHPENISKNFRTTVIFGIDYNHQDIAIDSVPQILKTTLQRALLDKVEKDQLVSLKVFFTSASASSLDYRIVADFDGELAPRMIMLKDQIQATCVEACNQNGWVIPFTQITVHEAEKPTIEECAEPTKPCLP